MSTERWRCRYRLGHSGDWKMHWPFEPNSKPGQSLPQVHALVHVPVSQSIWCSPNMVLCPASILSPNALATLQGCNKHYIGFQCKTIPGASINLFVVPAVHQAQPQSQEAGNCTVQFPNIWIASKGQAEGRGGSGFVCPVRQNCAAQEVSQDGSDDDEGS